MASIRTLVNFNSRNRIAAEVEQLIFDQQQEGVMDPMFIIEGLPVRVLARLMSAHQLVAKKTKQEMINSLLMQVYTPEYVAKS
jgi:hypothetical protein